MSRRKTSVSLILFLLCLNLAAQHRFMVFFTDKSNSSYSTQSPQQFLSQRALERRSKQNISVNWSDLPVNQQYIAGVSSTGAETYFATKWMNGVLIQTDSATLPAIQALPYVARIEMVAPGALLSHSPNETPAHTQILPSSTSGNITNTQLQMLGINRMHQEGFEGQGLLIGVFDAGFPNYSNIPEFEQLIDDNRILYTKDFTTNANQVESSSSHGTRVLSVMAGESSTYSGAAPHAAYILSITEAPDEYRIEEYNWLFAAEKADSAGVDIIQTSLGYSEFTDDAMNYSPTDMDGQTTVISRASKIAADKGILLVTSAGNLGSSAWQLISAPADVAEVISVGARDEAGFKASFSSIGPTADGSIKPDVVALGVSTAVITSNGSYALQNGTSFAAPIISGFAAGLWQAYPDLTAAQLRDIIRNSANLAETPDTYFGYGTPSYRKAKELVVPLNLKEGEVRVYPNPSLDKDYVTIAFEESFRGEAIELILASSQGQVLQKKNFVVGISNNRLEIELGNLPSGLYIIRIRSNGQQISKKLMIN